MALSVAPCAGVLNRRRASRNSALALPVAKRTRGASAAAERNGCCCVSPTATTSGAAVLPLRSSVKTTSSRPALYDGRPAAIVTCASAPACGTRAVGALASVLAKPPRSV